MGVRDWKMQQKLARPEMERHDCGAPICTTWDVFVQQCNFFYRYLPCQLVQDFFHQQYHGLFASCLRRVPMSDASLRCCHFQWCTWRHCSTDGHGTCATCRWIWRFIISFRGIPIPKCSMYGVFTYTYHKFRPNLGKYTMH